MVSLVLCACAASPVPTVERAADATDVQLTLLAAQLPAGASACVVAQPQAVESAHRALLGSLSAAEPWVWHASSPVHAYAEAQQRDRSGAGAAVRLIRFAGSLDGLRAHLREHAHFDVLWDVPPSACRPDRCPWSGRRVASDVVRLDRGLWRERVPGMESECVALARQEVDVVELTVRGAEEMALTGGLVPQVMTASVLRARDTWIIVEQRDEMDSVEAAQILAQAPVDVLGGPARALGRTEREQSGATVISTTMLRWDDVRVAMEDHRRAQDNGTYAELLMAMEPDDAVDPRQRDHALLQLRMRMRLLAHPPIDAQRLQATVSLAERVVAAHPNDTDAAFLLAQLYVRFTEQPGLARPLIDQHAAHDVMSERWVELRNALDAVNASP